MRCAYCDRNLDFIAARGETFSISGKYRRVKVETHMCPACGVVVNRIVDSDRKAIGKELKLNMYHKTLNAKNIDDDIKNKLIDLKDKFFEFITNLEDVNSIENLGLIKYSIIHSETVGMLCERYDVNFNKYHDLDKIAFYCLMSKEEAQELHRLIQLHHDRDTLEFDVMVEEIMDWESAHITKPDKPLSAYETLKKYYSDSKSYTEFCAILKLFDLWGKECYNCITEDEYKKVEEGLSDEYVMDYLISAGGYLNEIVESFD